MGFLSKSSSPTKATPREAAPAAPAAPEPAAPSPPLQPSVTALLELRIKELEWKLQEQEKATSGRISEARAEVSKARDELAAAERRWAQEKERLVETAEGERSGLMGVIDELKNPPKPKIKAPLYVEVTVNNALFSRPFHFFIEGELHGARDNTEVSEVSELPAFVRTLVFRVREDSDAWSASAPASLVLNAKAFIDEATHKLLGTARVALEPRFFETSDDETEQIHTPAALQFVRNAAVYGKCVVTLRYFRSPNAALSEPIRLELPLSHGFKGVPVLQPVSAPAPRKQFVRAGEPAAAEVLVGESETETARLKEELKTKTAELHAARNFPASLSEEVISELSSLSNVELRDRLLDATARYRAERDRLSEMRREMERMQREKSAVEDERRELVARLETVRAAPRVADEAKYRETILEQEKVIRKLETIIETSVKKIQSAESLRAELERLRVENKRLRDTASLPTEHLDVSGNLKERVAALEAQLIDSAKRHARELAQLKLDQSCTSRVRSNRGSIFCG